MRRLAELDRDRKIEALVAELSAKTRVEAHSDVMSKLDFGRRELDSAEASPQTLGP